MELWTTAFLNWHGFQNFQKVALRSLVKPASFSLCKKGFSALKLASNDRRMLLIDNIVEN